MHALAIPRNAPILSLQRLSLVRSEILLRLELMQKSKLTQVVEGNCPRIDARGLPHITKINHVVNDLEKLLLIMEYVDETLFKRRYEKITQLMRLSIQATIVKALLNF